MTPSPPDWPGWVARSGWTYRREARRWLKAVVAAVPGRAGSQLRTRAYGFGRCGDDVYLGEGLWVEYPSRLSIGDHVGINRDVFINAGGIVEIEEWVLIGPRVIIYSQNHDAELGPDPRALRSDAPERVLVRRGAWVASAAIVLPGVEVGEMSVVAAGAVVSRDVPAHCVVAGVPARIVKQLTAGKREGE